MAEFVVGTGIRNFPVSATDPEEAIEKIKTRLKERLDAPDTEMSFGLAEAHKRGRLHFVVFDRGRTRVLAGEYRGHFESPVSIELLDACKNLIPDAVRATTIEEQ